MSVYTNLEGIDNAWAGLRTLVVVERIAHRKTEASKLMFNKWVSTPSPSVKPKIRFFARFVFEFKKKYKLKIIKSGKKCW